jgi:hypothetical protein
MSPKNRSDAIKEGARQAAAQLKPAAERAKPLAKSAGEATRQGILRGRAWAAPQVERSGQALQDTVAPKVSELLSSAAKRIDPAQPRHRRWQKSLGLATLTAVGGAVAAFLRSRRRPTGPSMAPADHVKASRNGQASTGFGADKDENSQVTS